MSSKPIKVTFTLDEEDAKYFRALYRQAKKHAQPEDAEEIVTEGKDVDDHTLEAAICMQLGLPEPEEEKRGIVGRFFNK